MTRFLSEQPEDLVIRYDSILCNEPVAKYEAINANAFERPSRPGTSAAPPDECVIGSVRVLLQLQTEVGHQVNKIEHPLQIAFYSSYLTATARPMANNVRLDNGRHSLFCDLGVRAGPKPLPAVD